MYLVYYTDEGRFYGNGNGETHPIFRATKKTFETVEAASCWILNECLTTKSRRELFRIFEEQEIVPVWEASTK